MSTFIEVDVSSRAIKAGRNRAAAWIGNVREVLRRINGSFLLITERTVSPAGKRYGFEKDRSSRRISVHEARSLLTPLQWATHFEAEFKDTCQEILDGLTAWETATCPVVEEVPVQKLRKGAMAELDTFVSDLGIVLRKGSMKKVRKVKAADALSELDLLASSVGVQL